MQPIKQLAALLSAIGDAEPSVSALVDFAAALPDHGRGALKALLGRAVRAGLLTRVCHGIYCRPQSTQTGLVLYHAAARLRAEHFNYLSLESALSDAGVIAQLPISTITIMSSGRSHIVQCGELGRIEFVHTKKHPADVEHELVYDARCRLWRASVALALRDLTATRRSLDLVARRETHEPV